MDTLRPYVKSGYVAIYGQLVIYGYLIYTQWQLLGKVRKSFVAYAAAAMSVSFLSLKFARSLTSILVLVMQAWIIFQFLDPILYKIAMLHRKKRLAEEAKRREEEETETLPLFQLKRKASVNSKTILKGESDMADVKKLREDVERRMRNGESYGFDEIRKIMKSTGLSYAQVIKGTKKLNKDMKEAEAQAKAEGKPFDKEAYISARMRG